MILYHFLCQIFQTEVYNISFSVCISLYYTQQLHCMSLISRRSIFFKFTSTSLLTGSTFYKNLNKFREAVQRKSMTRQYIGTFD
jgi:hypothetical protein